MNKDLSFNDIQASTFVITNLSPTINALKSQESLEPQGFDKMKDRDYVDNSNYSLYSMTPKNLKKLDVRKLADNSNSYFNKVPTS